MGTPAGADKTIAKAINHVSHIGCPYYTRLITKVFTFFNYYPVCVPSVAKKDSF